MQAIFCDLCDSIIKGSYVILSAIPSEAIEKLQDSIDQYKQNQQSASFWDAYNKYLQHAEQESKHICPVCNGIIDTIFKYRCKNLHKLTDEILKVYNFPTKINPNERSIE